MYIKLKKKIILFLSLSCSELFINNINATSVPGPNPIAPTTADQANSAAMLQQMLQNTNKSNVDQQLVQAFTRTSSWHFKIIEWFSKSFFSSLFNICFQEFFSTLKDKLSIFTAFSKLQQDSFFIFDTYANKPPLYLTTYQNEFYQEFLDTCINFLKTGKNKPQESIVLLGGSSGTGKSHWMLTLGLEIYKAELKFRPIKGLRKLIRLLPAFMKGFLNINHTRNGIFFTMSGSYFYNYSNEQEKAASFLENLLDSLLEHIKKNPKNYFIFMIDEGEKILMEPFARVLKVFTTKLSQVNKNEKYGYGLIMLSTNYIGDINETLARRVFVLEFETPTADIKLKTFLLYLSKYMVVNNKAQYTEAIINLMNKWLKFCENFSHSDMENIVWLLKLKAEIKKGLVSFKDLIEIIKIEWKKRKIIVEKMDSENVQLQELDLLINQISDYHNELEENIINIDNFEKEFNNLNINI